MLSSFAPDFSKGRTDAEFGCDQPGDVLQHWRGNVKTLVKCVFFHFIASSTFLSGKMPSEKWITAKMSHSTKDHL
jgi:hypothetical protein